MAYTKSLNDIKITDHALVGDKAAHLGELLRAGFDVPRGFCITAEAYRDVIAKPLHDKIIARINACDIDDPIDLEAATDEIRAWIESAPLPNALVDQVSEAVNALAAQSLAVRASRVVEDVPNPAASGMQQAFLCVVGSDDALKNIRQCWAAPWNSRAVYFRNRKKMSQAQVTMAIVVQPMIAAEAAGVMFTANPLTGASEEIHIDATWGLGEAIIAARWKPDHFVVAKNNLAIRTRSVPTKNVMEIVAPDGTWQTVTVAADKQDAACLSDEQIGALADIGKKIQAHFNQPEDIEWCRVGEQISLLQTRPLKKR